MAAKYYRKTITLNIEFIVNFFNLDGSAMIEKKPFYFTRHGESEHNQKGLCAGCKIDSPLTDKGIAQAHLLKSKLLGSGIDCVISSPLIRAKRTAEIAWNRVPRIDEDLREYDLGIFEGVLDRGITEYVIDLPYHVPVPNGESKNDFIARITNSINKWLNAHKGTLLFVSHGFVYGALLDVMGLPIFNPDGTPVDIENAVLIHFHHNGLRWLMDCL